MDGREGGGGEWSGGWGEWGGEWSGGWEHLNIIIYITKVRVSMKVLVDCNGRRD